MSFSQKIQEARRLRLFQVEHAPAKVPPPEPFLLDDRPHPFEYEPGGEIPFFTVADLMRDTQHLAAITPPGVSRIVGVARSGLCVASMLSLLLHRPLSIVRQSRGDVVDGGNGYRLTGDMPTDGPILIVDDTVMSGRSLHQAVPLVKTAFPGHEVLTCALYSNPHAKQTPDLCVREVPWPHILEWNLFNSVLSQQMAIDFDGILCRDCPAECVDDEEAYLQFLEQAEPLYLPRRTPVPLIVTARLERYRPQTLAWLARHGVKADRLVMGPWESNEERRSSDVAEYKAAHFFWFLSQSHSLRPPLFVESCPRQAEQIAQLSGGVVVCPAVGRCFQP